MRKLKAVFAGECVRFSFEASAGSLLTTFSRLSWEKRLHFSIGNPQTLAERCKDKTREILRAFGWERAPECRKIGGERFYRWEKVYDEN